MSPSLKKFRLLQGHGGAASSPVDSLAPTVLNVTATNANGTYGTSDTIGIQVVFSEPVIVTGTPQLTLETGSSDAVVNYTSGSGTDTLLFNYTPALGHWSNDLDYKATNSLALNGGTIQDAAANNATLTLASPGASGSLGANKAIVIRTYSNVKSVRFPASGDYSEAASTPAALQLNNSPITISAWVKPENITAYQAFLGNAIGGSGNFLGLNFYLYNKSPGFYIGDGSSSVGRYAATAQTLADGSWQHIAVRYSNATKTPSDFDLFIGGTKVTSLGNTGALLVNSWAQSGAFRIGRNTVDGKVDYRGRVDTVGIYNASLSDAQIAALAVSTNVPWELDSWANIVEAWEFEDNADGLLNVLDLSLVANAAYTADVR